MRFVNKSKGILNFQGRLVDPGSKIFISEDSVVKYQSLLYKYYGEGLAVIEDYDGRELTVEDIRDIVAKRGVTPVRQHQKPEYMKIIEESAENNINTGKATPEVETETEVQATPEVETETEVQATPEVEAETEVQTTPEVEAETEVEAKVETVEEKQETKKRVTRKRNTKK